MKLHAGSTPAAAHPKQDIPWDDIDPEIRPLVRLLNEREGVATQFSCSGHGEGETGYVSFSVASLTVLESLLRVLPPGRMVAESLDMSYQHWVCVADTTHPDGHDLRFTIQFKGHPEHERYNLLGKMERALRAAG